MSLYVKKHPSPQSLYTALVSLPTGANTEEWEQMTEAQLEEWKGTEVLAGWMPEAQPAMEVPQSVTPWQMRRALNQLGLRAMVEAAVAAGDQDARDGWEFALEIRRDNPLLAGMAQALGMTDGQLDDLFRLAASFQ